MAESNLEMQGKIEEVPEQWDAKCDDRDTFGYGLILCRHFDGIKRYKESRYD